MGLSVLLIEDDPLNSEFVKIFLESEGYNVECAGSRIEATELLNSSNAINFSNVADGNGPTASSNSVHHQSGTSSRFDLLVTDIQLPDGNGVEVAQLARQLGVKRIIAVSGFDESQLTDLGFVTSVFDEILLKPIELTKLMNAITT